MAKNQKYTARQLINAIQGSGGIKMLIAERLGCHRHTVDNYLRRYVTVRRAYEEERETIIDLAEEKFVAQIKAGHWPAIRLCLMTLGRGRGYSEKTDVEAKVDVTSGGRPIGGDYAAMSDDELRQLLASRKGRGY